MTHDERRLLCLVARAVSTDNTTVSLEIRKLVKVIQRHENHDAAERRRHAIQDEDDADRRGEPR